jgi:VanZ family protein
MSNGIFILRKLPAPLIVIGIWFLSSQSILPQPKGIFGFDKIQHFIAYFVLALTIGLWFSLGKWHKYPIRLLFITMAIASIYGIIDEIHQFYVPGRNCNIWDWFADTIGAVLGALIIWFSHRLVFRISTSKTLIL